MTVQRAVFGCILLSLGCGGATVGRAGLEADAEVTMPSSVADAAPVLQDAADQVRGAAADAPDDERDDANDGGCATISASDFDQSCEVNSDCAIITEGRACSRPCAFQCSGTFAAISAAALPTYLDDLSRAGLLLSGPGCGCALPVSCCIAGRCASGDACPLLPP